MKVVISCFRWNLLAYRTDRARPLDREKNRSQPSKSSSPIPLTYVARKESWQRRLCACPWKDPTTYRSQIYPLVRRVTPRRLSPPVRGRSAKIPHAAKYAANMLQILLQDMLQTYQGDLEDFTQVSDISLVHWHQPSAGGMIKKGNFWICVV